MQKAWVIAGSLGAHETLCLLLNISCGGTCCVVLNELWGENGDLSCKVFKGNANSDTHRNTHSLHFFSFFFFKQFFK